MPSSIYTLRKAAGLPQLAQPINALSHLSKLTIDLKTIHS